MSDSDKSLRNKKSIFDDIDSLPDTPWPNSADRLVVHDERDWHNEADLSLRNWGDPWSLYGMAYREAADILVAQINDGSRSQDLLVYPIMFLYRQYLELTIKSLIKSAWRLLDKPEDNKLDSHDLIRYWSKCNALLEEVSPGASTKEKAYIHKLLKEFCKHDPMSYAFRYPESNLDKQGARTPTLPDLNKINLRNVKDVIANMAGLFNGAEAQIDHYLQIKADIAAEYRDGYLPNKNFRADLSGCQIKIVHFLRWVALCRTYNNISTICGF